jgi:hypothetical protein
LFRTTLGFITSGALACLERRRPSSSLELVPDEYANQVKAAKPPIWR